jgi:hypothetical protein
MITSLRFLSALRIGVAGRGQPERHFGTGLSGEGSRQDSSAFLKKSAQKTFVYGGIWRRPWPIPRESNVFCFPRRGAFFSKNKRFLDPIALDVAT